MKKQHFILFVLIWSLSIGYCQTGTTAKKSKRPSVGLVMSGGGAKGWAYLGVLRVLQEAGLEVDYISGASAGSIVGAMYAIGYHPDSIEKIIRSQNWNAVMRDEIERKFIAYDDKVYGGKYVVSLPVKKRKIGLSASLYEGQNIDLLLNRYYSVAYKDTLFSEFQTPFLCIGTDLISGEEVILDHGYLPQAIRSSMSIPAYFRPVDYRGHYLVDGGVVNNYPVTPLIEQGVDIIVGADVQSRKNLTKEDLQSITTILDQIIGFNRKKENEEGKEQTDLYLHLKMNYSMMDFNNYDSIIAFGERVAREHFDEISALADSLNAIEYRPLKQYTTSPLDSVQIDKVKYRGYEKMTRKYLDRYFGRFAGTKAAVSDIENEVNNAYGSGFFQSVFYELEYKDGKTNLVMKLRESSPGQLSAGIHYDSDYQGSILLNLSVRNIPGHRSKLFLNLVLGNYPLFNAYYLIDNGYKPGFGANFSAYTFNFDIYDGADKINNYSFDNYSSSVFIPMNIRNNFGLKAGFEYQYFRFKQSVPVDSVASGFESYSSFGELFLSYGGDTRDRAYFPTKGSLTNFRAFYKIPFSKDWNKTLFDNTLIFFLKYYQNIRLSKRFTLQPGLFLGAAFNKNGPIDQDMVNNNDGVVPVPVQSRFWVGGLNQYNYINTFVPFTGLNFVQTQGVYSAIGRLNIQYNFYKKLYATAMLDAGLNQPVWEWFWDAKKLMAGYGLKLSYDSFVGPVEISMMGSNMQPGITFFLNVGFWL